jgi:hypothetical protein
MSNRRVKRTVSLDAQNQFRRFVEEIEKFRNAAAQAERLVTCVADMPHTQSPAHVKRENARALLAVHRRRMFRLLTGGKTA